MLRRAVGRALGQVLSDHAVARLPNEIRDDIGLSLTIEPHPDDASGLAQHNAHARGTGDFLLSLR